MSKETAQVGVSSVLGQTHISSSRVRQSQGPFVHAAAETLIAAFTSIRCSWTPSNALVTHVCRQILWPSAWGFRIVGNVTGGGVLSAIARFG